MLSWLLVMVFVLVFDVLIILVVLHHVEGDTCVCLHQSRETLYLSLLQSLCRQDHPGNHSVPHSGQLFRLEVLTKKRTVSQLDQVSHCLPVSSPLHAGQFRDFLNGALQLQHTSYSHVLASLHPSNLD